VSLLSSVTVTELFRMVIVYLEFSCMCWTHQLMIPERRSEISLGDLVFVL